MRYEDENIWLTQKMMATFYDVSVPAINQHLKRIFADNELDEEAVIKHYLITAADGKSYQVKHTACRPSLPWGSRSKTNARCGSASGPTRSSRITRSKGWVMDVERLKASGSVFRARFRPANEAA
jgi:hypothetical protein